MLILSSTPSELADLEIESGLNLSGRKVTAEEWRPVQRSVGYKISRSGKILTCRPRNGRGPLTTVWRTVRPFLVGGYWKVNLSGVGHVSIVVLLLETFVGPRPFGMVARHLNDVKTDNRLENLAWGTDWDNKQDAIRNGRTGRGQKRGPRPLEVRRKISEAHKGKQLSEEHRRKIGLACKGQKRSEESRRRMSIAQMGNKKCLGYKHTEEAKCKISQALTGKVRSDLHCAALSKSLKGKSISDEHKIKLSISGKRAWAKSPERRKLQSAVIRRVNENRRRKDK